MSGRTTDWDAVVGGGGHNALVAAAYLGAAGLRTLVIERRDRVGGAVATSNITRTVRVPTLADTVGRLRPSVVRELNLRAHGLSLVAPEVRLFAPQPDGRAVTLWSDPTRTAAGLAAWSSADAEQYLHYDRLVRSLGRFVGELASETPPDLRTPTAGDAIAGLRLGRAFRGLGRRDARTLLRVLPMPVADFVAEWFDCDPVRAAFAWRGVRYSALGPRSAGTTAILLADAAAAGVAPGIGDLVTARQVVTPADLERDYGLAGGHPLHGEQGLDQFFLWRPLLGLARYRMPIEGLYLAGSGAHPGGGVTGGPGQNAAREILADWRRRRR